MRRNSIYVLLFSYLLSFRLRKESNTASQRGRKPVRVRVRVIPVQPSLAGVLK